MRSLQRTTGIVTAAALLTALLGCRTEHAAAPVLTPHVSLADLAPGLTAPPSAFALLGEVRSQGLFACSLAMAKFAPVGPDAGLEFVEMPRNEQAYWLEALRGVTAVRDLQFLRPINMRPEAESLPELCAAALRLGAPLLVLYAPSRTGANAAEVFGVIYDAEAQRPLATLHESARVVDPAAGAEVAPDARKGDHRAEDARWQAQRAFETQLRACLRELIHRDDQPATTQPHNWKTQTLERWWLRTR